MTDNDYNRTKEIKEAIDAGERALDSLKAAQNSLNSAGNWGLVDIFGGDLISGIMKHRKIDNASGCINSAKRDLQAFRDELGDIHDIEEMDTEVGDFLTFADFFFDGFVSDMLVQSKIRKAQKQVGEAIWRVQDILKKLRSYGS